MKPSFLIAAPMSGSGKTTIARGLMALFTQKGYRVQPYKCGPDYIDTKFHTAVCGRPSINLDTFMATEEHVRTLFERYGADADIRIVEGMMGLFDGYDRDRGSSADIARVLEIPVVLVVDARSAAYSMAALLQGFIRFKQGLRFAGVIYNKVGSARHADMLRQVCDDLAIPCIGCLPKAARLEQGSRYLGLDFSGLTPAPTSPLPSSPKGEGEALGGEERGFLSAAYEEIAHNLLSLLSENQQDCPPPSPTGEGLGEGPLGEGPSSGGRTLMARNAESFSFYYQENIDRLAGVQFFDPEKEVPDLSGIDLLYLPGGYPEKHAEALMQNQACRQAIQAFAERGGRVIAECGGMMYLCRSLITDDGEYPMCGVLPCSITARKANRRLSLGYRRFVLDGVEYRGHEFHYSQFQGPVPPSACQVYDAKGKPVPTPVFRYKNVLASYTHVYNISPTSHHVCRHG